MLVFRILSFWPLGGLGSRGGKNVKVVHVVQHDGWTGDELLSVQLQEIRQRAAELHVSLLDGKESAAPVAAVRGQRATLITNRNAFPHPSCALSTASPRSTPLDVA